MPHLFLPIAVITSILLLVLYVFAAKRHYLSSLFLGGALICCAAVELCDFLVLRNPQHFSYWKRATLIAESLLPILWLSYSLFFARQGGFHKLGIFQRGAITISLFFVPVAIFVPMENFFYSPDFPHEKLIFLGNVGYFFYLALLLFFILTLANLERNLLSLPALEKWRVKFEIIGAGVILAMFILYYSQGLLYRTLNMGLMAEKSAALLLGCGMIFYSFFRRGGLSGLYISRDMAVRSVVVLIIGIYFLGLGLAGEGMRYLGASPQKTFLGLVALLAGVAFSVVLLSETAKRRLKVFLHKNFYRQKYDYRNQWLEFTQTITAKNSLEELGAAILAFFCKTFAVHSASLFSLKEGKNAYTCLASLEMDTLGTVFPHDNSLIRFLDKRDWVFNAGDDNPEILEENGDFLFRHGVTYIVPLLFKEKLEGFVILGPQINPGEIATYEDYDLMRVLARQSANVLLSQKLIVELSEQREMAAIGKVSAFVIHDLKNLVSALDMTTTNARDFIGDPEFQADLLATLSGSVGRMRALIARLKDFQEKKILAKRPCDLMKIAEDCGKTFNTHLVKISGESAMVEGDTAELQKVLLNLVMNGIEACSEMAPVTIEVGQGKEAFLRVADQGIGMSRDFIDKCLFRPFHSTKKKGFGIGLYQCRNIVEAHGGRIEVSSEEGKGSVFCVYLPLSQSDRNTFKSNRSTLPPSGGKGNACSADCG
ncbi:MAG: PEP-CTERM system histidine kinase PrsK [Desulfuromonadaceae bacterium]|nr:PEP-CTERM system histidine kinase PrsK [Desulfuromonadaceae bacterium]